MRCEWIGVPGQGVSKDGCVGCCMVDETCSGSCRLQVEMKELLPKVVARIKERFPRVPEM